MKESPNTLVKMKKGPSARPLNLEGLSRDYCNKEVNDDL